MGNEQAGLPKEVEAECDELVRIPMMGAADSLNLASAGQRDDLRSLALARLCRARKASGDGRRIRASDQRRLARLRAAGLAATCASSSASARCASTGRTRRRCWSPKKPVESWKADAVFASKDDEDERGAWSFPGKPPPDDWPIAWDGLKLNARLAAFRHMGVFPEHSVHWRWAMDRVATAKRPVQGAEPLWLYRHDVAGAGEGRRGGRASRRDRPSRSRRAARTRSCRAWATSRSAGSATMP